MRHAPIRCTVGPSGGSCRTARHTGGGCAVRPFPGCRPRTLRAVDDVTRWPTGRLLSTAARLVEHAWDAYLNGVGLTHAAVPVLVALGDGPRTQRELAAASHVEEQTMSRTLDRLERAGYVARDRDPDDRRRVLVLRTEAGSEVLAAIADATAHDELLPGHRLAQPEALRAELVAIVERLGRERWG